MSSNYRGKNFDPNYHSRSRGNTNGYDNNNKNIINSNSIISNNNHNSNNNYNPQGPKRKRPNKGPAPEQGKVRGKNTNNNPNNNSNRNQHNNYYDDGGSGNQRVVLSPSSSFGEQSDIAESDSESEASIQSSEHGNERWSQGQEKQNGPGINGSNYRGPPEKYDPNYHRNKWKRARSSSGDPHEGGTGGGPSFNGVGGIATYGTYQSSGNQPTNSALVGLVVPTIASGPIYAWKEQEAQLAKLFGLVVPHIPPSTFQFHGGPNVDTARNERIMADIKEQLTLEIQQLEKERALAVKEKRDGDTQRIDFEILWRGAENGFYHMAFSRADMVSPPAEKYKYLLELQMNQNEARRRMEDRIKRETPSALRAIMGESSTTNQTPIQAGSASTSTSTLPQRTFAPTQGEVKANSEHDQSFFCAYNIADSHAAGGAFSGGASTNCFSASIGTRTIAIVTTTGISPDTCSSNAVATQ
ncbi:hypothetical protein BG003_006210 [Podila horticola]|nr:hypothetical protein BG003_006210 [Podila horticola]